MSFVKKRLLSPDPLWEVFNLFKFCGQKNLNWLKINVHKSKYSRHWGFKPKNILKGIWSNYGTKNLASIMVLAAQCRRIKGIPPRYLYLNRKRVNSKMFKNIFQSEIRPWSKYGTVILPGNIYCIKYAVSTLQSSLCSQTGRYDECIYSTRMNAIQYKLYRLGSDNF